MTTTLNLFPATVTTPRATYVKSRVQIEDGRVRVFALISGDIYLVEEADDASYERGRNRFTAGTISVPGEAWEIKRGSGCGCGHALRHFDPVSWSA